MVHVNESEIKRVASIDDIEERTSQIEHLLFVEKTLAAEEAGARYPAEFLTTLSDDLFNAAMTALRELNTPECVITAFDIARCLNGDIEKQKVNQAAAVFEWVTDGIEALYEVKDLHIHQIATMLQLKQ